MPSAHSKFLALTLALLPACFSAVAVEEPESPALTNIVQIRQLSHEDLEDQPDVHLQAVVTYSSASSGMLFIQDNTAGVYVWPKHRPLALKPGQRVELTGIAEAGEFSASVRPETNGFRVIGEAPLPAPAIFDAASLAEGKWDGQLSSCDGVVQAVDQGAFYWRVSLWTGMQRIYCLLPANETLSPGRLLDAKVRATGVGSATQRQDGGALTLSLYLNSQKDLEVLLPAPPDAFALEATPIQDASRLGPLSLGGHRIKVSGIVSLTRTNGDFFVESPQGGVLVRPSEPVKLEVGDRVEVAGFPSLSEPRPNLEQGLVKSLGKAAPVIAAAVPPQPAVPQPAAAAMEPASSPGSGQGGGDSATLWIALTGVAVLTGMGLSLWIILSRQADLRREHRKLYSQSTEHATKLARAQRTAEIEKTRATQQAILARLAASPTLTEKGLEAAIQELLQVSLDVLRAKRAGVWILSEDHTILREEWKRVAGTDEPAPLPTLPAEHLKEHLAALQSGEAISVAEVETDPRTQVGKAGFQGDPDTESILDAAIHRRSDLIGLLRHEHPATPREWTKMEQEFATGIAALISRLLAAPAGAPRGIEGLEQELAFQQMATRWSTRLLEESSDPSAETTDEFLEFVAETASAEVAEFGRLVADGDSIRWQSRSVPSRIVRNRDSGSTDWQEDLSSPRREWLWERLLRAEPILISHPDLLPPEAAAEREFLEERGCRSALYLPVIQEGQVTAVLSCATAVQEHPWPDALVERLKTLGRILAGAPQPMRTTLPESSRSTESPREI